ncbi:cyclic dof factor 3-like [Punica granatum]|uniref:Dof-type domain-containing protein n=2 Tax=Punica granatum TaxID=22663 RepID=A0A218VZ41_PUNGR|nr:cyclic dof factor 3-like [Punica granatum]OWM65291.1 hypothetical protein CDL15_Pgr008881 [Punica granatum]PKI63268.1 hypothetical protein CRG98_016453 [Punica granatum]
MLESKDPAIKLFGRQIPLSSAEASADDLPSSAEIDSAEKQRQQGEEDDEEDKDKGFDRPVEKSVESMQQDDDPGPLGQEPEKPEGCLDSDNPKTPSIDEEAAKPSSQKEQTCKPASGENQKAPKKPDKILPCPRCNSMDTKFCYYNNYNVNQPRHFCKACQRYWTAGGTMRNVPVGAGRRKNKSSALHNFRLAQLPLQAARVDAPNGTHGIPNSKGNGTVLRFGVDAPSYDSVAYLHDENKVLNGTRNGFHNFEGSNYDNCTTGSSVTVSSSLDEGTGTSQKEQQPMCNLNGFIPQVPCLPLPYPWNIPAAPGIFPPGFSIPYYSPVDYWNRTSLHGAWNVPWVFHQEEKSQSWGSDSPTLGKHAREEKEHGDPEQKNGCVLVPKTLRVTNPTEAAKSTIWSIPGIKNDSISSKGGLFTAFQSKGEDKCRVPETSPVLCANPAALSRSIKFHESS